MKKLSQFVVRVANQTELDVALKFFCRASRRSIDPGSVTTIYGYGVKLYVGMNARNVCAGPVKFDFETAVAYNDMDTLADTPNRIEALKSSGWSHPRRELPKPAVEKNPLVHFLYPSSQYSWDTLRSVRLIHADNKYYTGLEILPDNKFKFKKFLKAKARQFQVIEY